MKEFYRRRLPHWQRPGAMIFLTYRLFGSLPKDVLHRLEDERRRLEKEPERPGESLRDRALRHNKRLFALADAVLDAAKGGPRWLAIPGIADLIIENLFHHAGNLYNLWAFTVMPNHVHIVLEPLPVEQTVAPATSSGNTVSTAQAQTKLSAPQQQDYVALSRITHALKSYTANRCNRVLNRRGTFWQDESYDHWVRDEGELWRIIQYVELNPVKAGLAAKPEDWRWSSAYLRTTMNSFEFVPLRRV